MFNKIDLENYDQLPLKFIDILQNGWARTYSNLYEDGLDNINSTIREVLNEFFSGDECLISRRLIYLNWNLCLACSPTAYSYLPGDARVKKVNDQIKLWEKKSIAQCDNMSKIFDDILMSPFSYAQGLYEAILVLSNAILCMELGARLETIEDSLDVCLEGYAIAAGLKDRRPIFNWMINHLFPASYSCMKADIIYTMDTIIEDGWEFAR